MTPRVSVVMPVFNGGAWLDAALNSIRTQTLGEIEIIVVDDGSTDDSVDRIAAAARADPRIILVRQDRQRIVAALNRGIAMARGDLIARMDADDVAHADRLARQAAFLGGNASVAVLGTGARIIDGAGVAYRERRPAVDPAAVRAALRRGNGLIHSSVMMRRAAAALGYRAYFPYAEDYDLWTRVAERWDIANLPDLLMDYRDAHRPFDPGYFEQQIVSTVAVREAAHRRAVGEAEGIDAPVTRAGVEAMGLAADLRRELRRAAFGRDRVYAHAGDRAGQRAALDYAARLPPHGEGAGAWLDFAARLALRRARLALSRGQAASAASNLA